MRALAALFAFALVAVTLTGCGNMMKAKSTAEPQIEHFHQQFDGEKFADIYAGTDPAFQKATAEKKLTDLLSSVHRKLGKVKSSVNVNWNVGSFNMSTRIVMVQNTVFDQGSATETFTYLISGSSATLLGYNINSTDLIEK